MDLDAVGVVQFHYYFKLSVRVLGVLVDLFDGQIPAVFFAFHFVDHSEGALANDLDPVVFGGFVSGLLGLDILMGKLLLALFESGEERLIFVE